jgi:hypothetical protein
VTASTLAARPPPGLELVDDVDEQKPSNDDPFATVMGFFDHH